MQLGMVMVGKAFGLVVNMNIVGPRTLQFTKHVFITCSSSFTILHEVPVIMFDSYYLRTLKTLNALAKLPPILQYEYSLQMNVYY